MLSFLHYVHVSSLPVCAEVYTHVLLIQLSEPGGEEEDGVQKCVDVKVYTHDRFCVSCSHQFFYSCSLAHLAPLSLM